MEVGKTNPISNLNVKSGHCSGGRSEELNLVHDMLFHSEPDGLNVTEKALQRPEYLSLNNKTQNLQRFFQYFGQGKASNTKVASLTHNRVL